MAKYRGMDKFTEENFGNEKLSEYDYDGTAVMVTAYDISRGKPYFFKSWKALGYKLHKNEKVEDYDFKLADVARSTSAAPVYFPPVNVSNTAGKEFWFVDGGIFANNPSVSAISSVLAIYKDIPLENITVVSIGTGIKKSSHASIVEDVRAGGLAEWATKMVDLLMDGAALAQEYQMKKITQGDNYFRFQVELDFSRGLDDTSHENISLLTHSFSEAINGIWKQDYEKLLKILEKPRTEWQVMRDNFPDDGTGDE